jgi:MFS family permease
MMLHWELLLAALVVFVLSGVLYARSRRSRLVAVLGGMIGGALVILALVPCSALGVVPVRMRLSMAIVSLLLLYTTMEAIRRNRLKERYALLWIGTGLGFFGLAVYPDVIALITGLLGMHYTSAILVTVFAFVILVAFHICIALSRYEDDKRSLSQQVAHLQRRLELLEDAAEGTRAKDDAPQSP